MKRLKFLVTLIALLIALSFCVGITPVFAMNEGSVYAQVVSVTLGENENSDVQSVRQVYAIENIAKDLKDKDVIEILEDITLTEPIIIPDNVEVIIASGTERTSQLNLGRGAFEDTDENAVRRTIKKNFNGSLVILGKNSTLTLRNVVLDGDGKGGNKGGLISAKSETTIIVEETVTLRNSVLDENGKGGAIYTEKNSIVVIENSDMADNRATKGGDVYAEYGSKVIVIGDLELDVAYGKTVEENTSENSTALLVIVIVESVILVALIGFIAVVWVKKNKIKK